MDCDCDYLIVDKKPNDTYKLLNNRDPYCYASGRIKSFLTSYSRNRCAKVAMIDIDNEVRIHTDAVVYLALRKI